MMKHRMISKQALLFMGILLTAQSAYSMQALLGYGNQAINIAGQVGYAPLVMTGIALGLGVQGVEYGVRAISAAGSIIAQYPKISAIIALYALCSDNYHGMHYIQQESPSLQALMERMHHYPVLQQMVGTTHLLGGRAYAHLIANKELVAVLLAPAITAQVWDAVIGKNGLFVVEGIGKEMVVPSIGGLHLANWAYDRVPDATTLYHGLLDGDDTLRAVLLLEYSIGAINGWNVEQKGDIVVHFIEQIDRELAIIESMQKRLLYYVPNAPDMLKEAKKAGKIVTSQRHHSTEEREQKYWEWIDEKEKDPYSAKPNGLWVPTKKSLEALYTEHTIKVPNIFWRIYWYYGTALKVYAGLEQRKERLLGLRELAQTHMDHWWKEYQEIAILHSAE
jgi:hypothetical protein